MRLEKLVLVSGASELEGMLVSEMALLDRRQSHSVLRASKVLAHSTWMGANYGLVYSTPAQIAGFLKQSPVSTIILDRTRGFERPHHVLLEAAVLSDPGLWAPVQVGNCDRVRIFQRVGPAPNSSGIPVSIDMSPTLGRSLVYSR